MKAQWRDLSVFYRAAILVVIGMILMAFLAPWIAPYDPDLVSVDEILQPVTRRHLLGTDALGRDILSRLVFGARTSVSFALAAACCTMAVGMTMGILSGYFRGWPDKFIQCLVNLIQGLPGMSLMVAIAAILPESNARLIIAVTLTSWAGFSRVVRSEVIRICSQEYMEAVKSLGAGDRYILRKYVFSNAIPVLVVLLTLRIGTSLLSASALSYLGLGVSPPAADWGVMISDARTYFRSYPLMILAPGFGITLFCLAINLTGDALCEWLSIKKTITGREGLGG